MADQYAPCADRGRIWHPHPQPAAKRRGREQLHQQHRHCFGCPSIDWILRQFCERYFHQKPLFIEPGVKTGMPVLIDNPAEAGADRIANGVGAYEAYGGPCIVVDFGTATNFDVISRKGEFLGGAIAPGLNISSEALFARAARLPVSKSANRPRSLVPIPLRRCKLASFTATSVWSTAFSNA